MIPQRLPFGKQFTHRKVQFTTALPLIHERIKRSMHFFSGYARSTAKGGRGAKQALLSQTRIIRTSCKARYFRIFRQIHACSMHIRLRVSLPKSIENFTLCST